jgi:NAD(P)H-hydrate epimerase
MGTRLFTCEEMAAADRRAQEDYGIPAALLMENAARSAAEYILRLPGMPRAGGEGGRAEYTGGVLVAAGKGNNGADALAVCRHLFLAGCVNQRVLLLSRDMGELARMQCTILERLGVPVCVYGDESEGLRRFIEEAAWIIDGLYGIGLRGPLKDGPAGFVKLLNGRAARVVSLDVPSGLGTGFRASWPVVRADYTLSFEAPKLCQYLPLGRKACGHIEILDAGFPPECLRSSPSVELTRSGGELSDLLPRPEAADYKNSRGHIAVFAGSPGTTGAALLCGEAALRAGAGLVSLFAEARVYPVLACSCRSLMVKPLEEAGSAEEAAGNWDPSTYRAILAGPGWGRDVGKAAWLLRFIKSGRPGVLDADALHVLAGLDTRAAPDLAGWVLTPHPGEFSALTGADREEILADPLPLMREFCRKRRCVLVLKGHVTIIHEASAADAGGDGKTWIHDGMNPALGTAGSGDVLAGVVAAFLGRGLSPVQAALCAVELHAAAGRRAAKKGFFTAEDLLRYISREAYDDAKTVR